jgi:hypothetical protein
LLGRPEQAFLNSELFMLAVELLVACIQDNIDLLDVLLYPSILDKPTTQGDYFISAVCFRPVITGLANVLTFNLNI